ncbi:MAG TPA: magnesium chelatase [Leptospiraceae bacterium]|nr:magnesium chelatase [Spirochaetaceae bacterium]HBS06843.1 magnesium chelatase [Leptospiraceae bacterium]|tara:strand:+ start:10532 stop:11494 length:963 start_codon:yes stop_codon:yes gene_type:complete
MLGEQEQAQMREVIRKLKEQMSRVYVGQDELVRGILAALFGGGHALIEGVPGLGKTLLVRTLGSLLGCDFNRIQFTPDLMPSDITGSHIYDQKEQKFVFYKGPVFTNLLLADEINRAPAKTHSALLEIMQEGTITVDNSTFQVDDPFFVMATQNPVESEGTYNLPEAQLDRFLVKLYIDYPAENEEYRIYSQHAGQGEPEPEKLEPVMDSIGVLSTMGLCEKVTISESILEYVNRLVRESRKRIEVQLGCSPRAGIALIRTARVLALMDGRDYVIADDIKEMAPACFRHRLMLTPESEVEGMKPDDIVNSLLESVEVPGT